MKKAITIVLFATFITSLTTDGISQTLQKWTVKLDTPLKVHQFKEGEIWNVEIPDGIRKAFPPSEEIQGSRLSRTGERDCTRSKYGMMSVMELHWLLRANGLEGKWILSKIDNIAILEKKKGGLETSDPRNYYYILRQGDEVLLVETPDLKTLRVRTLIQPSSTARPTKFSIPKFEKYTDFTLVIYGVVEEFDLKELGLDIGKPYVDNSFAFSNTVNVNGKWKGGELNLDSLSFLAIQIQTEGYEYFWHYGGDCWSYGL